MKPTSRLQCELCGTAMTSQARAGSPVQYHHCPCCGRWVASCYGDELVRAGTARVTHEHEQAEDASFDRIKARLSRWIQQLDENDPYRVLGVPPSASEEAVRARFHQLAMEHHPDRGGDPKQMRRVLTAYERIRNGRKVEQVRPAAAAARAAGAAHVARAYRRA